MTEALLAKALQSEKETELLVPAVCHHEKWSLRNEIKMALLSNENTPLARALQFANELPVSVLKEILLNSRLSSNVKNYLLNSNATDLTKLSAQLLVTEINVALDTGKIVFRVGILRHADEQRPPARGHLRARRSAPFHQQPAQQKRRRPIPLHRTVGRTAERWPWPRIARPYPRQQFAV